MPFPTHARAPLSPWEPPPPPPPPPGSMAHGRRMRWAQMLLAAGGLTAGTWYVGDAKSIE
jgi:hypothetical protein